MRSLARVGLDDVRGYLDGGMEKWIAAGYPVTHVRQLTPAEFVEVRQDTPMHVVDVRTNDEWKGGHVSGARHVMGGKLADHLAELPRNAPLALICGSGYRSTVAASVLERAGFEDVVNITGGMAAWGHAGLPVETECKCRVRVPMRCSASALRRARPAPSTGTAPTRDRHQAHCLSPSRCGTPL